MRMIHDIEVDDYLKDCVEIEPTALEEEYVRLPADLAYWNERFSRANKAFLVAKIEAERVEARLHIECRERLLLEAMPESPVKEEVKVEQTAEAVGGKKAKAPPKAPARKGPTVSDIEAAVSEHPDMQKARDAMLTAEVEKARLYGVLDAVRAKKEMLISLGATIRAEMSGDPTIREQVRGTRLAREG